MSILVNKNNKIIVQGITGRDGGFHAKKMKQYGTQIAGGVSPGKGGQTCEGILVFNSVEEAVKMTDADTSIIFVPARFASDAIYEASDAGIKLVIVITEQVPVSEIIKIKPFLEKNHTKMIGPNCPGIISPEECLVGIMPGDIFKKGNVGLMSRSGTLTYEVVFQLTSNNIGQTTCIGIGGDPITGLYYLELLEMFENDKETEAIVLIGEIGGDAEEKAARYIKDKVTKPVIAFIAGQTAPPGKRMGHAGAIISSSGGTAQEKIIAFENAGIPVAKTPSEIPELIKSRLR
jgi:succinyl-CoA synthetase alpha subunit